MKSNRRAFLRGAAGISIGLPLAEFTFDLGGSQKLFAQETNAKSTRLLTMYFPNGARPEIWNFESALAPLADVRDKIILMTNVANPVTKPVDDGHEQGAAALFTGAHLLNDQKGTSISMDQWLSRRIDSETALKRPLVMGVWRGWAGGQFRSPTWYRRSWMENGDPVNPIIKPLEAFKLLFGDQSSVEEKKFRLERQKSVLDSIVEQYKSQTGANSKLPSSHKQLLAAHLERVRELEKRVSSAQNDSALQCVVPKEQPPRIDFDTSNLLPYSEFERVYRLQMDLMALAFQCGLTNTGSLMFCSAGEEYVNPLVSNSYTDHGTSHFSNPQEEAIYIKYRQYHASNLRYMIDRLKALNILDTTTIMFGSEFGDGRSHVVNPQPMLVAGGGGNLKMGQVIDASPSKHTGNDVYATVLTALGHKADTFGIKECNVGHIKAMMKV